MKPGKHNPSVAQTIHHRDLALGCRLVSGNRTSLFRLRTPLLTAALGLVLAAGVLNGTRPVCAQVVQLPTFRSFGVGTTVLVPDRGSALLGGVKRGQIGSVSRGVPGLGNLPGAGRLFNNRASGSSFGTSTMSVTATIIDLNEMDEAILAEAASMRADRVRFAAQRAAEDGRKLLTDQERRKAEFLSRNIGRSGRK